MGTGAKWWIIEQSIKDVITQMEAGKYWAKGWKYTDIEYTRKLTLQETMEREANTKQSWATMRAIESMQGKEHLNEQLHDYEIYLDKSINRYVMVINGGEYIYYPLPSGRKLYKVSN